MNTRDKILIWLAFIVFLGVFTYMISGILLPFVVAIITSYFLDPAADRMEKAGFSRTKATIVIAGAFFITVLAIILMIAPLLYNQFTDLVSSVPEYIAMFNEKIMPSLSTFLSQVDQETIDKAQSSLSDSSGYVLKFLTDIIKNIWSSGLTLINLISLAFVTPVVTFYMLRDWDKIIKNVNTLLPPEYAPTIREQVNEIDRTLSGYIRGQTQVCILLGIFYATGLTLAGLEFGLFIGMATGILSFIPFVGMLIGFVCGILVAFFQFGDLISVAVIAGIFILGQIIEGNFVTPKLVGDRVGLHPVWIIFGMLAGAALFGFVGVLLAVPVTAILGVVIKFILKKYMKSPLYREKASKPKKTSKA